MKSALFLLSGLLCTAATLPADVGAGFQRPDSRGPRCKCGCMAVSDCGCTNHKSWDCPPVKKR